LTTRRTGTADWQGEFATGPADLFRSGGGAIQTLTKKMKSCPN
jgi:hypothetical protein